MLAAWSSPRVSWYRIQSIETEKKSGALHFSPKAICLCKSSRLPTTWKVIHEHVHVTAIFDGNCGIVSKSCCYGMALATTPKRCRSLYTKQKESSPCRTAGPTRKRPDVLLLSSCFVRNGELSAHLSLLSSLQARSSLISSSAWLRERLQFI